ncbi:MAG: dienelactone hydrolase family protein, partial [Terriglobia bacterium]
DQVAAAASFHGGGLYTNAPASPHTLLPRVKARLYFGHGIEDRSMPQKAIEKLDRALAAWGGRYESEIYQAHHGWTVPDNPAYNETQAERAYKKLTDLLNSTLKRN